MQNSSDKTQQTHDQSGNGMEESPSMTIEYLRARLHSERAVSKAARERADELARRVGELEEQLKVVSLQRKRAEKATLDVLSFLESRGISDLSDVYESESDQEESLCGSNAGKCEASKEDENFGPSEFKGVDKESLASDNESTPSIGRSLSWKGRKEANERFDKQHIDSSNRRRTSFSLVSSSPRHRTGKSCRQIKRRETRSTTAESRDLAKCGAVDDRNWDSSDHRENLGRWNQKLKTSPQKLDISQECDGGGSMRDRESNDDMERALEHQARLIGCYEAEEKAQRDWEQKYEENNVSTTDSFEPGNHSDITEEREENRSTEARPSKDERGGGYEQKSCTETNCRHPKPSITYLNSFKITSPADEGFSQNCNYSERHAVISLVPEFSFTTLNDNKVEEHIESPSLPSSSENPRHNKFPSSSNSALAPLEETPKVGAILDALQDAKSLIKRQMKTTPETNNVREDSQASAFENSDWLKASVGCSGLFRVPMYPRSEAPNMSRLLDTNYLATSNLHDDRFIPRYSAPRVNHFSDSPVVGSNDFYFNTRLSNSSKSAYSSFSSFPDTVPHMSPNHLPYNPAPRSNIGIYPSSSPLNYDYNVRENMYR